jgi:LmbE family N-acetylglucosaminyl deacetylase
MKLFVSPHNDDAALFGAFTLQREIPRVLTVFDSYVQVSRGHARCTKEARQREDWLAATTLGCRIDFAGVPDNLSLGVLTRTAEALWPWKLATEVWLPAVEPDGHDQHNLVGEIGLDVFSKAKIHRYLTYTRANGKSTNGVPVPCTGAMVLKKLQALACYKTQIEIDELGCWPHFLRDQTEYLLPE